MTRASCPLKLRPLLIPSEHGAWALLLEPVALAMIVAPSVAGDAVVLSVLAAFLARHPLRLAMIDLLRGKRYARTIACSQLAAAFAVASVLALVAAVRLSGAAMLLPFAIALPLAAWQFIHDVRGGSRALVPEIAGAAAMGATAASIALAAGQPLALAMSLWCLTLLRSIPAIVFVRAALGRNRRTGALVLHVFALAVAFGLWRLELVPAAAVAAMALLLARAGTVDTEPQPARRLGIHELGYGAATTLLAALGYRLFM